MLEQDIRDIRENLQRGYYQSEAEVSQGIVRRLLATLKWPVYDTKVVWPEYPLERRHVDYALCHPARKPRIFIEVKGVGKSDNTERQLFEYAFHQGVPLAILTDGRKWSFFLPAGTGSYHERRIYKLMLVEHEVTDSARKLERYLSHEAVRSGAAFTDAQDDYWDVARDARDARERGIPDPSQKARAKLVADKGEYNHGVIADCVENLYGYRPDPDTVEHFTREMVYPTGAKPPHAPARIPTPSDPPPNAEEAGAAEVTLPQPFDFGAVGLPRPLMLPAKGSGSDLSPE